jgi:hypothetical protein
MSLKIEQQPYNTIWVSADSQKQLGETFIRFQEYYESPSSNFKNKIFTLGQVKQWYSENYGSDNYSEHWVGFNLPSVVLKPFRSNLFDPLTDNEKELLDRLKYRQDNFYIVGAQTKGVLRHELSHAMYSYSKKYRDEIDCYINTNKTKFYKIQKYILEKGYCKEVLNDEIQAYITDMDDEFILDNLDLELITGIIKIYKKHKQHSDD